MCTVILFFKVVPSHPIVLAGNRDEFFTRRSRAFEQWESLESDGAVRILAGRDEQAGGTWFGVNEHGVVAGVTNRYTGTRDPRKLSRGNLVLLCLGQRLPADASGAVAAREAGAYNPFNLFCLSRSSGFSYTNYPEPRCTPLRTGGIYLFTNRGLGEPQDPKIARFAERMKDVPLTLEVLREHLPHVLRGHEGTDSAESFCVHLAGYGTVSSYFLAIGQRLEQSILLTADGPPCRSPYRDLSRELLVLLARKNLED